MLRTIKNITGEESGYSVEFIERNFALNKYTDPIGRKLPCYFMTRDGFIALAMGFTGKKADHFKEAYIKRFNEMEQHILTIQALRDQHPLLTEAIRATRKDPKPWDYSNEADMINRIVLGMTAKKYREVRDISKSEAIRPHMTAEEAELMSRLQIMDVGLQYSMPDFQQRKHQLEWYAWSYKRDTGTALQDDAAQSDTTAIPDITAIPDTTAAADTSAVMDRMGIDEEVSDDAA